METTALSMIHSISGSHQLPLEATGELSPQNQASA